MIELSNKLKEPVVLRSEPEHCNLKLMHGVHKTREQAILEKLLGYSFYVEAKITRNQQIKLYLHQVIETQNGQEKSTLPIANMSIEISDMYDTIGNVLWSASHGHLSSECASSLSFGHYCKFKSKLTVLLREMFQSEISKNQDLCDLQNIHIGGTQCSCCVQISNKMILDMGVKHYLNSIARSIIACVRSPGIFGKYKPQTIIITGSLLSEWTKLNNTLYRYFIWKQLQEELCLSLYQHQMKVHLIMSRTDVELFSDERLIKQEKYQQVVGDKRILVCFEGVNISGKLYKDKGDRYELVPRIKIDGKEHWRLYLVQNNETLLGKPEISSRYYFSPSKELKKKCNSNDSYKRASVYFKIDAYIVCTLQDQQDLLNPFIALRDDAFIMRATLNENHIDLDYQFYALLGAYFPIAFTLEFESHHMKTRFSLKTGCSYVETVLIPGRITLREISS
ncbi:unnamed protein product [Mucor fragilis]